MIKRLLANLLDIYKSITQEEDIYLLNKNKCLDYLNEGYVIDINPCLMNISRITLMFLSIRTKVNVLGEIKQTPVIVGKFNPLKGGLTYFGCWDLNGRFIKFITDDYHIPMIDRTKIHEYFDGSLDIVKCDILKKVSRAEELVISDDDLRFINWLLTDLNSLHESIDHGRFISIGLIENLTKDEYDKCI